MKVDQSAIEAIRLKVQRAREHFNLLGDEMLAFQDRHPYRLVGPEVHADGAKHFYRLRMQEPVPTHWSVVLGEAIHDLRSALDHAIYQLTIDYSRRVLEMTQFPVFMRRARFDDLHPKTGLPKRGSGLFMIRGVGPGPRAFIERLQPYPQRTAQVNLSIRVLHDFWNQDKHRLVHLWGIQIGEVQRIHPIGLATWPASVVVWIPNHILHEGAIATKVFLGPSAGTYAGAWHVGNVGTREESEAHAGATGES